MATGLRGSKIGYNVNSASDKELTISSDWPLLPLEAEGVFEVTNALTQPVTIYNHGLGYEPIFKIYFTSDFYDSGWYSNAEDLIRIGTTCSVDTDNLVWNDIWFSATPMYLYWKIFRRPIKTTFNEPNYILTDTTKGDSADYGLLVSKSGQSVESDDKRNFSIRTDYKQLVIDQSDYTTTPTYSYTLTHNLGYPPIYWGFYQDSGAGAWRRLIPSYSARTFVTDNTIQIDIQSALWGAPAPNLALLTFKNTLNTDE